MLLQVGRGFDYQRRIFWLIHTGKARFLLFCLPYLSAFRSIRSPLLQLLLSNLFKKIFDFRLFQTKNTVRSIRICSSLNSMQMRWLNLDQIWVDLHTLFLCLLKTPTVSIKSSLRSTLLTGNNGALLFLIITLETLILSLS